MVKRFAELFFPDEDSIGRQVTIFGASRQIVGVSQNVFHTRMPREGGKVGATIYLPMTQQPHRSMSLAMRVSGEPGWVRAELAAAIDPWPTGTYPESPVLRVTEGVFRGRRYAEIWLAPVRTVPGETAVEVAASLRVEVSFSGDLIGRYEEVEALDPAFRYFAKVETGEDGLYSFRTIRPRPRSRTSRRS